MPRQAREELMLDAALRAFADRGYHAVSMDEIAAGAGITKPMLYSYFGSKEGLYEASIERAGTRLTEAVDSAVRGQATPEGQLWAGILAFFTWVDVERDAWRTIHRDLAGGGPGASAFAHAREQLVARVAALLADTARAEGLPPTLAAETTALGEALAGAAEAMATWWLDGGDGDARAMAVRLMNIAWTGLERIVHGELWLPPAPDPSR
jgi:AcrR family transcriptional regulator